MLGVLALASTAPVALVWWLVFRRSAAGFWLSMALATGVLGLLALALRTPGAWAWAVRPSGLALGVAGAVVLYAVFLGGERALRAVAPAVAASGSTVYGWTGALPRPVLAGLLLLVIAPGEELYWRGLVQWELQHVLAPWIAVLAATALYTAVHLTTRNPALILAALVCGLFWGAMYAATGSLPAVIVSHCLWDCLALLWLPLRRPPVGPAQPAPPHPAGPAARSLNGP